MSSQPKRNLSQEVLSATLWNTALFPARFLVGIVISVIYYQKLSLEQVALLFWLTNLASSIGMYADLGIERALPRFIPDIEQHSGRRGVLRFLRRMIALKLAIMAVLVLVINLAAVPLGNYLAQEQRGAVVKLDQQIQTLQNEPQTAETTKQIQDLQRQRAADVALAEEITLKARRYMLAVSALLILGALFDVYMQFLTAYFKQRAWNLITIVTTMLQPLLVTLFILLGWGIDGVLLGLVITPLISVVLAAWQARRASHELSIKPVHETPDPTLSKRFTKFAAVSYLLQITTWFYDIQFVVFVAGALLLPREVALLVFAYKFAKDYLGYVWIPLSGVMTPLLARIKLRREPEALREAHASLTRMIWLVVVPAGVGLALLAPRLIAALYPKYIESTPLIIAFIAATFGESLLSVPHNVLMVYEEYRAVIISRLFAFLSIPLVFIMLPRFGLLGVAIAVGLIRVGTRLFTLIYGIKRLGLTVPSQFWGRVMGASASFAILLMLLMQIWSAPATPQGATAKAWALVPLLMFTLIGAIVYIVVLRVLGGLDPADRDRLLKLKLPFKQALSRVL
ncbi:MAG: oligosaccharide flippase family protein [Herpetosiphon sp.]|nr:oligosaccharide flippase family protein [Herpetosiphon sp.]